VGQPRGEPVVDEAASAEPETSVEETESVEETIIPEVVSDDEAVDDSEPATRAEPVIDVVPLTDPVLVSVDDAQPAFADEGDDDAEHVEIVATTVDTDTGETVVEQMVIDEPVPASNEVPPAPTSAAPTGSTAEAAEPPLAPIFRSPTERAQPTGDQLPSSFDDLISVRNAAAKNSISTTSALVLPSVPGSNDVGTALDETGEVIITGSIDLPASFGAMGAPASGLESNDLDSLLERSEAEVAGSDVAPVSASRAISTNTSSTSLIAPPKRARANAPVVLAVTAAVLAVGVVGLLLAVFVFRVF
ncbi:MAG: hypothetical protein Q7T71_05100, partial [Herbiconiux sp.]|nr:hypothetical protein [Herbiconiux sp.]